MKRINTEIEKNLLSKNKDTVLNAIKLLRTEGNYYYINILGNILLNVNDSDIEKEISNLFFDLKDQATVIEIIDLLKNKKYKPIHKLLITSCWQNSLNFSSYFLFFTELVINEDFETAIEAFSVIDNMENNVELDILQNGKDTIRNNIAKSDKQKMKLLQELFKLIDDRINDYNYTSFD